MSFKQFKHKKQVISIFLTFILLFTSLSPALASGKSSFDDAIMQQLAQQLTSQLLGTSVPNNDLDDSNEPDDAVRWSTYERISLDSRGFELWNDSFEPAISADGRYVVYSSISDVDPYDDIQHFDNSMIYLYDRLTGRTELISRTANGKIIDATNLEPTVSGDGNIIAFTSISFKKVDDKFITENRIYLRDRQNNTTVLVSKTPTGEVMNNALMTRASMSSDGNYIVFRSNDPLEDNQNVYRIYLYDRNADTTQLISTSYNGDSVSVDSLNPMISNDGQYIVFESTANNLVENDTNSKKDIFLYNRLHNGEGNGISLVSLDANGKQISADSVDDVISHDGNMVIFATEASLVEDDTNFTSDIYIRYLDNREVKLEKISKGDIPSVKPFLSQDGNRLLYVLGSREIGTTVQLQIYNLETNEYENISPIGDYRIRMMGDHWIPVSTGLSLVNDDDNYSNDAYLIYKEEHHPVWQENASLEIESYTDQTLILSWTPIAIEGTRGYHIYQDGQRIGYTNADTTRFTVTDFVPIPNKATQFRVEAVNHYYNLSTNGPVFSLFDDGVGPTWPADAVFTALNIGTTSLQLGWTAAEDAAGVAAYKLYRIEGSTPIHVGTTNVEQITIFDLEPNTEYSFRLRAVDHFGHESAAQLELDVTTLADEGQIPREVLSISFTNSSSATLTWNPPRSNIEVDYFTISRAVTGEAEKQVGQVNGDAYTYTDQGLLAETSYSYTVRGIKNGEEVIQYTGTGTTPSLTINSITYQVNVIKQQYIDPLSTLELTLIGEPNRIATARISYLSWYNEDGNLVDEPKPLEIVVPMTESATKGEYTAIFEMPDGAGELTSIVGVIADEADHEAIKEATGLPLTVLGSLEVTIEADDLNHTNLQNSRIQVWSSKHKITQQVPHSGNDKYQFTGLIPGSDYLIRFFDAQNQVLSQQTVTIRSGMMNKEPTLRIELPTTARFQVKDVGGNPIPDLLIHVYEVTNSEHPTKPGKILATLFTNNDGWTPEIKGLSVKTEIKVQLELRNKLYFPIGEDTFELQPLQNEKVYTLTPVQKGTLSGKVINAKGDAIPYSLISVSQKINDQLYSEYLQTDDKGEYKVDLYEGPASISVNAPHYQTIENETVTIKPNTIETQNIVLQLKGYGFIKLDLYTKFIEGNWVGPISLNMSDFNRYEVTTNGKRQSSNPLRIEGGPGDKVTVCVNGYNFGLPTACEEVVLDQDGFASVEIRLAEQGSRIEGTMTSAGKPIASWSGLLYHYSDDAWHYIKSVNGREGKIDFNVPADGVYKLQASGWENGNVYVTREFQVNNGGKTNIGTIPMVPSGVFQGQQGNHLSSTPYEIAPGGTLNIRVNYVNSSNRDVTNADLLLEIPAGTTLVEGSVMLNQKSAHGTLKNGIYRIPIGTISKGSSGVVIYKVTVDETYAQTEMGVTARMNFDDRGSNVEEIIASTRVTVAQVTLEAPDRIVDKRIDVGGKAPAGAKVTLYDGDLPLGTVLVTPAGFWSMTVQLTNSERPSIHNLIAKMELAGRTAYSNSHIVYYDPTQAQLIEVTFEQRGGTRITIEPAKGVARFPYVVVPDKPYRLELKFNHPNAVKNVQVYINDVQEHPAIAIPNEQGIFIAEITNERDLGPIYVTYDTVPLWNPELYEKPLTDEEIRKQVMPALRNYEVTELTPLRSSGNNLIGAVGLNFKDLNLTVDSEFTITPNMSYTLTQDDNLLSSMGIPVYGLNPQYTVVGDNVEVEFTAYVPSNIIGMTTADLEKMRSISIASIGSVVNTVKVVGKVVYKYTNKDLKTGLESLDLLNNFADIAKSQNDFMKLNDYLSKLGSCPEDALIRQSIEYQAKLMLITGVSTGVVGIGLGLLGATGVGLIPAAALFGIGLGFGLTLDQLTSRGMDHIENMISRRNGRCDQPPVDIPGGGSSGGGGSNGGSGGGKGSPVASPTPIYDPSGYVYEAVESNRIEGVKASVYYLDPISEQWVLWDAEWFRQLNPQITDEMGKYGWDVPKGLWQVVYEKDGYETARSAELQVTPPHFDVNIGMISLQPPTIVGLTATSAPEIGTRVDIRLDKYIDIDFLTETTVIVKKSDDTLVIGTLAPIHTEFSPTGEELTRTLRFTSATELPVGSKLQITLEADDIISYAGIQLTADFTKSDVEVLAADLRAPLIDRTETNRTGNRITLTLNEALDTDLASLSVDKFTLAGTNSKIIDVAYRVDEANHYIDLYLDRPVAYGAELILAVAAEAWSDPAGNRNTAIISDVHNRVLSNNSTLSGITLSTGSLSPNFNSRVLDYTVTVPTTTNKLTLAALLGDLNATLIINGMETPSGEYREIALTDQEMTVFVRVVAEDQVSNALYTVTIKRTDGSGGPTPPGGIPTSDTTSMVVQGGTVDLTRFIQLQTLASGELQVRLSQQLINEALSLQSVQQLMINLSDISEQRSLLVTPSVLTDLLQNQVDLVIDVGEATITLPFSTLAADHPLLTELLQALGGSDVVFNLDDSTHAIDQRIRSLAGLSFEMGIAGALNSNTTQIQQLIDLLQIRITLNMNRIQVSTAKMTDLVGIYMYDPVSDRYRYLQPVDNATKPTFILTANGAYFIGQYINRFTDIAGHWAEPEILQLAARLIVQGVSLDRFAPEQPMSRAEFVAILARALDLSYQADPDLRYTDVDPSAWYFAEIMAATQAGIVTGIGEGAFLPNRPITREEMVTMVIRVLSKHGLVDSNAEKTTDDALHIFPDAAQLQNWSRESMNIAVQLGFIKGMNGNQLAPQYIASRAQAAVLLLRVLDSYDNFK